VTTVCLVPAVMICSGTRNPNPVQIDVGLTVTGRYEFPPWVKIRALNVGFDLYYDDQAWLAPFCVWNEASQSHDLPHYEVEVWRDDWEEPWRAENALKGKDTYYHFDRIREHLKVRLFDQNPSFDEVVGQEPSGPRYRSTYKCDYRVGLGRAPWDSKEEDLIYPPFGQGLHRLEVAERRTLHIYWWPPDSPIPSHDHGTEDVVYTGLSFYEMDQMTYTDKEFKEMMSDKRAQERMAEFWERKYWEDLMDSVEEGDDGVL